MKYLYQSPFMPFVLSLEKRRKELGMPVEVLVKRSGVSKDTFYRLLKGGRKTDYNKVAAVAQALGVEATFRPQPKTNEAEVIVTEEDAREFIKQQARWQAKRLVGMVQGTMGLEGQGVDAAYAEKLVEETTVRLLSGPKKRLWFVT